MEKKSNKKLIIGLACLAAAIVVLAAGFFIFRPKAAKGSKSYTLEVCDSTGTVTTYTGTTDAEYLKGVLDELAAAGGFSYEGTEGEYGTYVTVVNGETADYNVNGAYWAVYVNYEYANYGISEQPVTDGDTFGLVYTE